jgi:hypothetical protein
VPTICVPASPGASAAAFTKDRRAVIVALSAPARPGRFACSALFNASSTLLGAGAGCAVEASAPSTLVVTPRMSATIKKDSWLSTLPEQAVLVDDLSGAPFNFTRKVADCTGCAPVAAILTAPAVRGLGRAGGCREARRRAVPRWRQQPRRGGRTARCS